jgi:hypothetical protein
VVAVGVNLLAAGGIAMPPVALGLWTLAALGQNLREDRPCGRPRAVPGGRMWGLNLAMVATMLVGAFVGAVVPDWRSRAAIARAEAALARPLPDWDEARAQYLAAAAADRLSDAPWRGLADVEFRSWVAGGAKASRTVWIKVAGALEKAVTPPRDPNALAVQRLRMGYAGEILRLQGESLTTGDRLTLHQELANAAARAAALYPTDATLHALLAEAVAALGRADDAKRYAREALRLDALTPHADKKLAPELRDRMRTIVEPSPESETGTGLEPSASGP